MFSRLFSPASFLTLIFWQSLLSSLFITSILVIAIWLTQILRFMDLLTSAGPEGFLKNFGLFTLYVLPDLWDLLWPFGSVLSLAWVYSKLTLDRELVAAKALGTSPLSLSLPSLGLGTFISLFLLSLQLELLPACFSRLRDLDYAFKHSLNISLILPQTFYFFPGVTLFVNRTMEGGEAQGLFAYVNQPPDPPYIVSAKRGHVRKYTSFSGDRAHLPISGAILKLEEGTRISRNEKTGFFTQLDFKATQIDIHSAAPSTALRTRKPSELPLLDVFQLPSEDRSIFLSAEAARAHAHGRILKSLLPLLLTFWTTYWILSSPFRRKGVVPALLWVGATTVFLEGLFLACIYGAPKHPFFIPLAYSLLGSGLLLPLYLLGRSPQQQSRPS